MPPRGSTSKGPPCLHPVLPAAQPFEDKSLKKGEVPGQPRGLYTSPAKKGSFGFNKLTISQRVGAKGVATE